MTIKLKKTKKNKQHSSRTTKNDVNDINYKSTYEQLFNAFEFYIKEQDWEATHITEDDILKKFINEILDNKYKTKQEIITIARLLNKNILSKTYTKLYA